MRKLYLYMALFLLALAAGCQREEIDSIDSVEADDDVMKVYATIEDIDAAQTKTYLSGTDVYWSSGDKIAVFNGNLQRKLFNVDPESAASKDATFKEDKSYSPEGSDTPVAHNVAYYPFCDVTCAPDGSSYTLDNLTLPATQSYVEGSVGLGAFPMVAVTENTDDVNFRFQNICGVMQFQLTGYGYVKSVSVKGNNEEVLSGPAVVTAGYGKEPSIAMSAEGGKIVTLDCGEGGVELNETTPVSFFIVLPPVQFEGGFTITVTDTWGGSKEYSTTKKNPVGRSNGLRMPSKEYVGERPVQEGDYVDEYGVNHGQGVEIDGVVWAPVNCGYHKDDFKYGKLYQWGRKYGQGYDGQILDINDAIIGTYSDAVVPTSEGGGVSVVTGNLESNAEVFYTGTAECYNDWVYPSNDMMWNAGTVSNPAKTEYDPCPNGWRVPTYAELDALQQNRSSLTTDSYSQIGYWFSGESPYATNALQVFLPAAGGRSYVGEGGATWRGSIGYYWSSGSKALHFHNSYIIIVDDNYRRFGYSVRCVKYDGELIPVSSVILDKASLSLNEGETYSLSATIAPSDANHQVASWYSDDTEVATVDLNGNVTAVSAGSATISAIAGMQTAVCTVTVLRVPQEGDYVDEYGVNHGQGVEIDGVVWAPVNCGYHATDFKYGKLYQWGRKYGQGYSGSIYDINGNDVGIYSDAILPTIEKTPVSILTGNNKNNANIFYITSGGEEDWAISQHDNLWNIGTESDPIKTEYDPCPDGWRVPTYSELNELHQNYSEWTTNSDGQVGYWFSGTSSYKDDVLKSFFPAVGERNYNSDYSQSRGIMGSYWSSAPVNTRAYYLWFHSVTANMYNSCHRTYGYPVRCVQDNSDLIPVSDVILNESTIVLAVGNSGKLSATIAPSDANHQVASWYSDDTEVATVDLNGNVTAVSAGSATISAIAGMQVATCEVTVNQPTTGEPQEGDYVDEYGVNHGQGVEIDGVVWAPVNCGYKAATADSKGFPYGKLYQWGRKYGQGYSDDAFSDVVTPTIMDGGVTVEDGQSKENENIFYMGSANSMYDWVYPQDGKLWNSGTAASPVKTEYDPCPKGWRVPTYTELDGLSKNTALWTSNDKGQNGYLFSDSSSYSGDISQVFFPAAGRRIGGEGNCDKRNTQGYYRSSYSHYDGGAYYLSLKQSEIEWYWYSRAYGYSVRCVLVTD